MKQVISTANAPSALGPYSQAVEAGGFVYVSGQLGLDPQTMELAGESAKDQAQTALGNVQHILEAAGLAMDDAVMVTVLLNSISDYAEVNEVYASFFSEPYPARAVYEVGALPKSAAIEIMVIAVRK
ncbi:MAG: RidA family protein [Chitinivibrionales bacterium]|nr:RidA family protein [Chitinivibrionales bacterium]MBD3357094.1 RidA family protein [Chitinivibrionales bacterium]